VNFDDLPGVLHREMSCLVPDLCIMTERLAELTCGWSPAVCRSVEHEGFSSDWTQMSLRGTETASAKSKKVGRDRHAWVGTRGVGEA